MSFARDFRRGVSTFKSFGNISLLFEGEDASPFCRVTLWPMIKLCLQEGSLAQALDLAYQDLVTSDSFIFHLITLLSTSGMKVRCGTISDHYLAGQKETEPRGKGEKGPVKRELPIDYGF